MSFSPTHKGITSIDLCLARKPVSISYDCRAGLDNQAIVIPIGIDEPCDMVRQRPVWKKVDKERLALDVAALKDIASEELWEGAKTIVERLPWACRWMGRCKYWNEDLERMRLDTMWMKRGIVDRTVSKEDYDLVRHVYRNTLTA